jgi:hypothetical protein
MNCFAGKGLDEHAEPLQQLPLFMRTGIDKSFSLWSDEYHKPNTQTSSRTSTRQQAKSAAAERQAAQHALDLEQELDELKAKKAAVEARSGMRAHTRSSRSSYAPLEVRRAKAVMEGTTPPVSDDEEIPLPEDANLVRLLQECKKTPSKKYTVVKHPTLSVEYAKQTFVFPSLKIGSHTCHPGRNGLVFFDHPKVLTYLGAMFGGLIIYFFWHV